MPKIIKHIKLWLQGMMRRSRTRAWLQRGMKMPWLLCRGGA